MRRIRDNFIAGLLVLLPTLVTLWILYFIFSHLVKFSLRILPPRLEEYFQTVPWSYGLWVIVVVLAGVMGMALVGVITRNIIGKKLLTFGERILSRIPLVSRIYLTVQRISQVFLGGQRGIFLQAVLVEYPRKGLYSVGFVTSRMRSEISGGKKETLLNIFIPTTPNPTSGLLIIVPERDVIPLDIRVEEALSFVISAGVVPPPLRLLPGSKKK